jgi:hypothetical protein
MAVKIECSPAVGRSQKGAFGRPDDALSHTVRGRAGPRPHRYLGQYRSCIVMLHDSIPSRKVATGERLGTSDKLRLRENATN